LAHAEVACESAADCFYNYQEGSGVKSLKAKIGKNYISLFYICFVANIKGAKSLRIAPTFTVNTFL
jgi:hypothetical protein